MNVDHVDDVDNVIVGENRVPCRNQCKHGEGMQSTHRKALPQWNSDRGASCCETNVLTAAPPCCRYRMGYGKFQNRLPGSGRRNWWKLNGIDTKVIQLKLEMRTELGGWWEPKDKPKQAWPTRPNAWDEYASTKAHAGGNANQAGRSLWGSTAKASCGWTTNPDAKGWKSKLGCSDRNRETLLGQLKLMLELPGYWGSKQKVLGGWLQEQQVKQPRKASFCYRDSLPESHNPRKNLYTRWQSWEWLDVGTLGLKGKLKGSHLCVEQLETNWKQSSANICKH